MSCEAQLATQLYKHAYKANKVGRIEVWFVIRIHH